MKVIDFIICDDIRKEIGNKHSLIGIYEDAIKFNVSPKDSGKWPKIMKTGFFIRIKIEDENDKEKLNKFRLNINYNGKARTIAEGVINNLFNQTNAKRISLAIVFNQFNFENSGSMSVNVEFLDNANQVIHNLEMPNEIEISENITT
jgi:hypothetical protein